VTRKSYEVPQLKEAINEGILSVSQASRIASVITPDTSSVWIQKAKDLKQRELERETKKHRPDILARPRLSVVNANQSELKLVISRELETKLLRLQEVLRTTDLNSTLEKMAEIVLTQKDPVAKATRAFQRQIVSEPPSRQVAVNRTPLPSHTASRRPLRQPLPAGLKHAVVSRDKGCCQFKNCGERRWTEIHHIQPISLNGENSLKNLTTLCSAHHRYLHADSKGSNEQLRTSLRASI
jgi:hypothetical protein